MTSRTRWLLVVLGVSALIAVADYVNRWIQEPPPGMNWESEMSAGFERQWATITAADKISDSVARCKQYPDPPWLHWKPEMVTAFCEVLARPTVPFAETKAALQDGQVALLDERFRHFRDSSLSDPSQRGLLDNALDPFDADTETVGELAQKWVELAPHSQFALTARGEHYTAQAFAARGTDFVGKTPQENFRRMHELFAKARADLEAALAIDGKLIPAYVELMSIGAATSDRELIEHAAYAALKIDPADDGVYLEWMHASQPRWGGSMQAMQRVADKAARQLGRNPRLALMLEKPVAYPAYLNVDSRNATFIMATLDEALQIAPSANDLQLAGDAAFAARQPERALWYFSQSWRFSAEPLRLARRAKALDKLGKREWAKQSLPESIDTDSLDAIGLDELAGAYWELGMLDKTESLFDEVLRRNPHEEYAMSALSNLYLTPPKRENLARQMVTRLLSEYPQDADAWYYDSMLKFSNKEECDESARKFLELVNHNDPYEQSRIAQAKAALGGK
jgi:tetratricopeptide (TPR) repeat protein